MHEMSIAVNLIEQAVKLAKENNLSKIDEIEIEIGALKQVIPDVMQTAFEVAKEGTAAGNAKLTIFETVPLVLCNECDISFEPRINDFLCPQCRKSNIKIIKGNEIIFKSIISN